MPSAGPRAPRYVKMFSGIIESIGRVKAIDDHDEDKRLSIDTDQVFISDINKGESICVNGVCLTVVDIYEHGFISDISNETLSCTTLSESQVNSKVNLEKALQAGSRLNGHLVSGHVDGIGTIMQRSTDGRSERFVIEIPDSLGRYICKKGSVCINGVSLTVNESDSSSFSVNIIPHTLEATTFGDLVQEDHVNIEVDMIARYLESLYESYQ